MHFLCKYHEIFPTLLTVSKPDANSSTPAPGTAAHLHFLAGRLPFALLLSELSTDCML